MEPEEQVDRSGRNERKGVLAEGTAWAKPESFVWWWGVRGVCTSGARRSLKSGGVRSAEPCGSLKEGGLDPEGRTKPLERLEQLGNVFRATALPNHGLQGGGPQGARLSLVYDDFSLVSRAVKGSLY